MSLCQHLLLHFLMFFKIFVDADNKTCYYIIKAGENVGQYRYKD
nr:MAG TPA: hypothetical protein [Caudoviricetes sp.]